MSSAQLTNNAMGNGLAVVMVGFSCIVVVSNFGCLESEDLDTGQVLTVEIAEQFLKNPNHHGLKEFTSIEDAAAEVLVNHDGWLLLDGLVSLSDSQAEILARHKHRVSLASLTELSDGTGHVALATKLAMHPGRLDLNDLKSISDAAAESLSKHVYELELFRLKSLSDAAAESLSNYDGELTVNHDTLPPSASKILRDAGH